MSERRHGGIRAFWKRLRKPFSGRKLRRRFADPNLAVEALGQAEGKWPERIKMVCECPDNAFIPRHADAGKLKDGIITMHNGIKVGALGYYGAGSLNMLVANRGVHEPQEERVFAEALATLPRDSVMVELGAYWGFYSMWFQQVVPGGITYLIEPRASNIDSGRLNFQLNGMRGDFTKAWIGGPSTAPRGGSSAVQLDDFAKEKGLSFIHLLHSDIQGAELEMLEGAARLFAEHLIGYICLSTHSVALHHACVSWLQKRGYLTISSATPEESYSFDGVLVMRSEKFDGLAPIEISRRTGPGVCANSTRFVPE